MRFLKNWFLLIVFDLILYKYIFTTKIIFEKNKQPLEPQKEQITGKITANYLYTTDTFDVIQKIKKLEPYYTEGLLFDTPDTLIESGGLYGSSSLVRMDYPPTTIIKKMNINSSYFAEGIGICRDKLFQLTYRERKIIIYSYPSLNVIGLLPMDPRMQEGWGMAIFSKDSLVASDGTNRLFFLDCNNNLQITRIINVSYLGTAIDALNSLTFANGYIYANRYWSTNVYKIDPSTGIVAQYYHLSILANMDIRAGTLTLTNFYNGYVLNGIAYNSDKDIFVLTGKEWGYYYELNLR